MEWDPWSRIDYLGLARYVTPEAKRWLPLNVNRFDLIGEDKDVRYQIIKAIYDALQEKRIYYDPPRYDPSSFQQNICTPAEILNERQQVTCLDLAILFCGLCLGYDLLSTIVVIKEHALAAVSLESWRGTTYRRERSLFDGGILTDPDRFHKFIELIDEHAYLAVECTGFAYSEKLAQMQDERYPESIQRVNGVLSFEQAVRAGYKQLDLQTRPFQAAVDIDLAHEHVKPHPLAAPASSPKPFLAPSLPDHGVVGRKDLLSDLKQYLFTRQALTLTALDGLPGVGKTTLAVALAHDPEVRKYFSDGVLWAGLGKSAQKKADIGQHLDRWEDALGISYANSNQVPDIEKRKQRLRDKIGLRKMLLVADDVWKAGLASDLRDVGGKNCAFLVTTRLPTIASQLSVEGNIRIMVEELTEDESLKLLEQLVPELINEAPGEARALAQAVGGLPLALTLMGKRLLEQIHHQQTSERQRQLLKEELSLLEKTKERFKRKQRLERHPSFPSGASISLMASIDISYRALGREARRMFRALAVFPPKPSSFSEKAALDVSAASAEAFDKLTASGLLELNKQDRYTLHQTIFDYAGLKQEDARLKQEKIVAEERMVKYFAAHVDALSKTSERDLEIDEANIRQALELAHSRRYHKLVIQLCIGMLSFWHNRGRVVESQDYLSWGRAAVEAESQMTVNREDRLRQADLALAYGRQLRRFGNLDEAIKVFEVNLAIRREIQDFQGQGIVLGYLGRIAHTRGRINEAEAYCQEALAIHREKAIDQKEEGVDLSSLGQIAHTRGDFEGAERYYEQSLPIRRKLDERGRGEGMDLCFLGMTKLARGQLAEAEDYYNQSLAILQIQDQAYKGVVLTELGYIAYLRGQLEDAERHYQEAKKIVDKGKDRLTQCVLSPRMAALEAAKGNLNEAENLYREGLAISQESGYAPNIADALLALGSFLVEKTSKREEGCPMLLEAAKRYQEMGILREKEAREDLKQLGCE